MYVTGPDGMLWALGAATSREQPTKFELVART
jgi:hypothetical protein